MIRSPWIWRVAAALYTVINAGGAVYAAAMGDPAHAGAHVGLLVLGFGAYVVWKPAFLTRGATQAPDQLSAERLDYLQQSVDAIALEVERIGEAQRFSEKVRAGRVDISLENARPEQPPE